MRSRNISIDLLRGVAIYVIIWAHVCLGWMLDEIVNVTALGLFFCISGYFYRQQSLSDTVRKKTFTLLKPWLIFTLIGYLYHMITTVFIDHGTFRWDMIFVDLILGCDYEANIPCWFFISMFEIIVAYTLLIRFNIRMRTLIIIALFFAGETLLANNINYLYIGKTSLYLIFLHSGVLIKQYWVDIKRYVPTTPLYITVCILLALLLFYVKIAYVNSDYIDWIVGYVACILIFMAMLVLDEKAMTFSSNPIIRFISYVGKNSLLVFALHILTNDLVWRLLFKYFHTPNLAESFMYACISLMLCLPAIPIYNWIFGGSHIKPLSKSATR